MKNQAVHYKTALTDVLSQLHLNVLHLPGKDDVLISCM